MRTRIGQLPFWKRHGRGILVARVCKGKYQNFRYLLGVLCACFMVSCAPTNDYVTENQPVDGMFFDVRNVVSAGASGNVFVITYTDDDAALENAVIPVDRETHNKIFGAMSLRLRMRGNLYASREGKKVVYHYEELKN